MSTPGRTPTRPVADTGVPRQAAEGGDWFAAAAARADARADSRADGNGSGSAGAPRATSPRATTPVSWLAQGAVALGVIGAATGLEDLLRGSGWWVLVIAPVLMVTAVGAIGRALRWRWWVAALAQLLALSLLLGAWWGVWNPAAGRALAAEGLETVQFSVPPVAAVAGLGYLLAGAFGLVMTLADRLLAWRPALVAAPLLAVVATVATIAPAAVPLAALAVPAVVYALVLALAGQPPRIVTARAAGSLATATAVLTAGALAVGAGLLAASSTDTDGRLVRPPVSTGNVADNPMTQLTGDLQREEEFDVMTLEGLPSRDYVRAAVLTQWLNGEGWKLGELTEDEAPTDVGTGRVAVTPLTYVGRFLPVPDGAVAVGQRDAELTGWRYDAALRIWHRDEAVAPPLYVVQVGAERPSTDMLRADTITPTLEEIDVGELPEQVRVLAQEITAGLGPFDAAQALQRWFTDSANGFTYDLSVPPGTSGDPLLDFLELRTGFCEQYASAMAVMARSVGLPARVVVGYGPGSINSRGVTTITSFDAHAWVEIRFDGAGWVRFDPTPPTAGQLRSQGFVEPAAEQEPGAENPTGGSATAPVPQPDDAGPTGLAPMPQEPGEAGTAPAVEPSRAGIVLGLVLLVAVIGLVGLLGWGPQLLRRRRSRSRGRVMARGGPRATATAWREIEDLAIDHQVELPPGQTLRRTARAVAEAADLDRVARAELGVLVLTVERSWFAPGDGGEGAAAGGGEGAAAGGGEGGGDRGLPARAVSHVRDGLEHRTPVGPLARWFPRSLLPRREQVEETE